MLQPLRGRVLVEVLEDAKRTESGLFLAGIKDEVPHRGKIISMGGAYRDRKGKEHPWGISEGHIVHFKRSWDFNKVKHYVIRRDMIYAVEFQDKAYAIADYIIVKKLDDEPTGRIILPHNCEVEVAKQTEICEVVSVGREDKMGIQIGDRLLTYRNEGLAVRIPLQPELWSLKPRAVLAKIAYNNQGVS